MIHVMGVTSNKNRVSLEDTKVHIKGNMFFFVFAVYPGVGMASCGKCFSRIANQAVIFF